LDWPESGTYVLVLRLARRTTLSVGALGDVQFERGYFTYVGSARRGLRPRLSRHISREKRKKWHIDWLTTSPNFEPVAAATTGRVGLECKIARMLSTRADARVKGFGCSDCGCESHLAHFPDASSVYSAIDALGILGVSKSALRIPTEC
jgi:sugar fermentation stimulation protein A